MNKKYTYTDEKERVLVLDVYYRASSEDEGEFIIEGCEVKGTAELVDFESLSESDRAEVETELQKIADENAHENWFEQRRAAAENAFDSYYDR